jgi:hypothetical protein
METNTRPDVANDKTVVYASSYSELTGCLNGLQLNKSNEPTQEEALCRAIKAIGGIYVVIPPKGKAFTDANKRQYQWKMFVAGSEINPSRQGFLMSKEWDAEFILRIISKHYAFALAAYVQKEFDCETCPRCTGVGGMPHFAHVADGICFRCLGTKVIPKRKRIKK